MTEEKKKRRSFEDQLRITDRTSCEQAMVVAGLTAINAAPLWIRGRWSMLR